MEDPSRIVGFFEEGSRRWEPLLTREANWLFYTLAGIDCVWLFISKVGETHDLKDAWNHMMPRIVGLLFWFNLVRLGLPFLISIPMSFMQLGQRAGNSNAFTASSILADGFNVATALLHSAYESGGAFDLLTGALFGVAAIFIILGYALVAFHFMTALIELWTSLRAAFLFIGFSGSRWTEPYAERYITLLISTGLRLMILELFVGFGHQFTTQWWFPAAQNAPQDDVGVMRGFEVPCAAMLFGMICAKAPEKIAGILSGSPALSAGSITSFVSPLVQSGIAGVTMIYSNVSNAATAGERGVGGFAGGGGSPPNAAPSPPQPARATSATAPPAPLPR